MKTKYIIESKGFTQGIGSSKYRKEKRKELEDMQEAWDNQTRIEEGLDHKGDVEYTCCNIEITEEITDIGLCPECLEHI